MSETKTADTVITVTEVEGAELYRRYRGQTTPQRCYVYLDARTGHLGAAYDEETGNAVPFDVHRGHVTRWSIPALKAAAANRLLAEIAPIAARVVAGYDTRWDGHNRVATYTDDAHAAIDETWDMCDRAAEHEDDALKVWDAGDWFAGIGSEVAQARELGVTAEMTDAQLGTLASFLDEEAADSVECDMLEGTLAHVTRLRDAAFERLVADVESAGDYAANDLMRRFVRERLAAGCPADIATLAAAFDAYDPADETPTLELGPAKSAE